MLQSTLHKWNSRDKPIYPQEIDPFAPEPPVTASADPRPFLPLVLDVISLNGQGQLCPLTFHNNNSVKDTGEEGKKPFNIDPKIATNTEKNWTFYRDNKMSIIFKFMDFVVRFSS